MLIEFTTADGQWVIRASDRSDDGVLDAFWPVYDQAFVLASEKEERSGFVDCLALNAGSVHEDLVRRYGAFVELVLVAQDARTGAVVGGANVLVAAQPAESAFAYSVALNYLFLDPHSRGQGASRRLVSVTREAVGMAAQRIGLPADRPGIVFLELNDPFRLSEDAYDRDTRASGIDPIDRLAIWARHGVKILAHDYSQPALSTDQDDDHTLALGVMGVDAPHLEAAILAAHLERFFAISVAKGMPMPEDGTARRQLKALLGSGDPGDLQRIELVPLAGAIERLRLLRHAALGGAREEGRHRVAPDSLRSALDRRGRAHFTLSLMFTASDIEALIQRATASTAARREALKRSAMRGNRADAGDAASLTEPLRHPSWSQSLLHALKDSMADSGALQKAIAPMFADIADLDRNLFVTQFLLDTEDEPAPDAWGRVAPASGLQASNASATRHENFGGVVSVVLPPRQAWVTEGRRHQFEFKGPVVFRDIVCRFFWVAHSDGALSWHGSFEVPYGDTLEQVVGLSMMLQALDPGEADTSWLLRSEGGMRVQETTRGMHDTTVRESSLLDFLARRFGKHVSELFAALPDPAPGHRAGDAKLFAPDQARMIGELAWPLLVLGGHAQEPLDPVQAWCDRADRRRVLVLLRDWLWFEWCAHEGTVPVPGLEPISGERQGGINVYEPNATLAKLRAPPDPAPSSTQDLAIESHRRLVSYFLSGFFQNVVDFFEQDSLEVADGLEPLFPVEGRQSNEGFLLYATQTAMFELVARSRSLDRGGRRWIGTCPYAFLVHLQAMHNEMLVRQYERYVSQLVRYLEDAGFRPDPPLPPRQFTRVLEMAFESLKDFRLRSFAEVHKHYAFGGFRYETERGFSQALEHMRGTEQRRAYWEQVLQHLSDTVDGLREDRRSRFETKIAIFGGVLAVTGLLQLWAALVSLSDDAEGLPSRLQKLLLNSEPLKLHTIEYALGLGLGAALLAWLVIRLLRRFDAGDPTAWRRYEEQVGDPRSASRRPGASRPERRRRAD